MANGKESSSRLCFCILSTAEVCVFCKTGLNRYAGNDCRHIAILSIINGHVKLLPAASMIVTVVKDGNENH